MISDEPGLQLRRIVRADDVVASGYAIGCCPSHVWCIFSTSAWLLLLGCSQVLISKLASRARALHILRRASGVYFMLVGVWDAVADEGSEYARSAWGVHGSEGFPVGEGRGEWTRSSVLHQRFVSQSSVPNRIGHACRPYR
jgi:hypothetical protein